MPAKRELSMRQLRHLLRLHHDGVSAREIGRRLGVARSTIQDNMKRAAAAGLSWPLADDITEEALEARLFGRAGVTQGQRRRVEPDWPATARELKRPGVTMSILWEEYREVHPEGYGYSRFCDLLREFERRLTPVMRQHHVAGEKAFVDYSGKRIGIADPTTGEIREAEIFVGVLGASNLTYAEATWTQTLPDWTGAHVRMFRFFGGAPKLLVPDYVAGHIIGNAALAGAAPESKGPGMGVEHHLLALPRIRPDVGHAAVAKPGVRDLSFEGDAVEDDPFLRPIELVGLGRREGQRNKGLAGLGLRLRRPNIRPAPSVTAHRVIAAGIAGPPKRLE